MPDIKPFRGIRYNPSIVSLPKVVAPPYDVISPRQQAALYDADPHNIVRLILGREENPYLAAAEYFQEWMTNQILLADGPRALYLLAQTFKGRDGKKITRRGFIAACKLEELGKGSIFPHERTHSGPREDRFRLFQATHAMFSQIFGLYGDPEGVLNSEFSDVMKDPPVADVTFEGVQHTMWRMSDERRILVMTEFLRDKRILIADGHHRYETALLYRDACRFRNPGHTGKEPYNFVPMFFSNMHDPGLVIFPTHRLVHGMPGFDAAKFKNALTTYFTLTQCDDARQMMTLLSNHPQHAFGLVLPGAFFVISVTDKDNLPRQAAEPEAISLLDVTVLHTLVLQRILNITDEQQEKKLHLWYEQDAEQAIAMVDEGKAQAAFLMNPTKIEQVRVVATAGRVMPQKSTFFYPKLLSGLVTYSFADLGDP